MSSGIEGDTEAKVLPLPLSVGVGAVSPGAVCCICSLLHLYKACSYYFSTFYVCTVHLSEPNVSHYFAFKHCIS